MKRTLVAGLILGLAAGAVAQATTINAEIAGRVKAGDVYSYYAATPRPYPIGTGKRSVVWEDEIKSPGALWIRVHFTDFDLAPGDFLTVSEPGGSAKTPKGHRYTGRGPHGSGDFWAFSVEGDTAIVRIYGGRRAGGGYTVTEVAHGTLPNEVPTPEVICGSDGRRNVACYTSPSPNIFRPIARLLFQSGGSSFVCTGWLARGSNSSTMVTNNHCFDTQSETNTVQARFNYQTTTCTGTTLAAASNYNGGTFLRTSPVTGGFDYTIFTLQGNPEATWGELIPTTVKPSAGSVMLFPQHPGGGAKRLGKYENSGQTTLCDVTSINLTLSGTPSQSQFSYGCDSEGGSSGSPIMNSTGSRVWGLHHFGNVGGGCNNGATHMNRICTDAGSLLQCATN